MFTTGDGRTVTAKDIADVYRDVSSIPIPTSGKISRSNQIVASKGNNKESLSGETYTLTCGFSTRDCDTLESNKTTKIYSLTTTSKDQDSDPILSVSCLTHHLALSDIASAVSENGRFLAKLRSPTGGAKSNNGTDTTDQLLEIWDRSRLVKTINVGEIDAHGQINTDPVFASFRWSPFGEQDKLLYVCQAKKPKFHSLFKQQAVTEAHEAATIGNSSGKQVNLGDDHSRLEDWGECLKGIEHTLVAVLDAADDCKITTFEMKGFSLGDSRWLYGSKIVSVAYFEEPRRLGLIYCNNRPSNIVVHNCASESPQQSDSEKQVEFTIKSDTHAFATPRVSHSGKQLIYLKTPLFGPHKHSSRLCLFDVETKEDKELADATTKEVDHFIMTICDNCFSTDDKNILFVKNDHLRHHLCLFSLSSNSLRRLEFPTVAPQLLDFRYDIILASGSDVTTSSGIWVSTLRLGDAKEKVTPWHQVEESRSFENIEHQTVEIPVADGGPPFISAHLISPKMKDDLPTIVVVHGGPHSAFLVGCMPKLIVYARLGLRSLLINYRGSTGVDEDYLKSLCGKIGTQDVNDCLHAIRHFVNSKMINPEKLIIYGGSHGGFLSCHLSCQTEFKFTSAIIINPVVDLSTMHSVSDIPDWCYVEGFNQDKYDPSRMPNAQEIKLLYECSPMSKYKLANVPTLMLLGTQDRRVPMFQGERWFELLKARGVEAKCKVYADKHDLGKVDSTCDYDMSAIMWMLSHLNQV